ncbi:MAG: CYTH domain-containing protein [Clostridia bacterium]|nr:CYTH domain-containing protein [Clostridia bacterium]
MEKINLLPQTEKGLKIHEYEKKFLLDSKTSFEDVQRVVALMGSFGIYKTTSDYHLDFYYDTQDHLLQNFNASVRLREEETGKTVSIKYKTYIEAENSEKIEIVKEFSRSVENNCDIINDEDTCIFIENKLRDIYAHHVDLDLLRKLKQLKPILVIRTDRTTQFVKNNDRFSCSISFDETQYKTKRQYDFDKIIEIKLTCMPTDENLFYYERFLKELRTRVILIPMTNTKYDVGMRVSRYEKKRHIEVEEEE